MAETPKGWLEANRANWDARARLHLDTPEYDLTPLREGRANLCPMEHAELPDFKGKRVLHLQCHYGRDSLVFLQDGAAEVVGVDFSPVAIAQARDIAEELGYGDRARFVECNVYDALDHIDGVFDLVYVSWGTIAWLPDLTGWARVVEGALKPGGRFYYADAHPAPFVLDDLTPEPDGRPGWFMPYFNDEVFTEAQGEDYAGDNARLPGTDHSWNHPISETLGALWDAGMVIDRINEHDSIVWPMFKMLVKGEDGMFRWPDKRWFPLSLTIQAHKPQ